MEDPTPAPESPPTAAIADRYRAVAGRFTERVGGVEQGSWERPAPCEGWVARDVVRHLVDWLPGLLRAGAAVELAPGPAVEDDPLGAWLALSDQVQALLDDPATAGRPFDHPRAGRHRLDEAIALFFLGDVLIHTWDLARATGQDETLDPTEVHRMLVGVEAMGDALEASGQYAAPVAVAQDADEPTRLLALTGRRV